MDQRFSIGVPGRKTFPLTTSLVRLAISRSDGREARRSTRLGSPLAASRAKGVDRQNLHPSRLIEHVVDLRSSTYVHGDMFAMGRGPGGG